MVSSGSACTFKARKASSISSGPTVLSARSPTATCFIRTKWSSPLTTLRKADTAALGMQFDAHEVPAGLLEDKLVLPAYEQMVKASHAFNLLDARHAVSVTERQRFILRVRTLARGVAEAYRASREALGFPLLKKLLRKASGLMSTQDLLFELLTEELPPRTLAALSSALTEGLARGIDDAGIPHGKVHGFATPRRLPCSYGNWRSTSRTVKWNGADRRSAQFIRCAGRADSGRRRLRQELRCAGERARSAHHRQRRVAVFRGTERGAATTVCWAISSIKPSPRLPIAKRMRWGAHRRVREAGAQCGAALRRNRGAR
jgi:hypothetical protein